MSDSEACGFCSFLPSSGSVHVWKSHRGSSNGYSFTLCHTPSRQSETLNIFHTRLNHMKLPKLDLFDHQNDNVTQFKLTSVPNNSTFTRQPKMYPLHFYHLASPLSLILLSNYKSLFNSSSDLTQISPLPLRHPSNCWIGKKLSMTLNKKCFLPSLKLLYLNPP